MPTANRRNISIYICYIVFVIFCVNGPLSGNALCAEHNPAAREDLTTGTGTGNRHGGSVDTYIDPRTGDTVHSVTAPRRPEEQAPPITPYVYPVVRPHTPPPNLPPGVRPPQPPVHPPVQPPVPMPPPAPRPR